MSVIAFSSSDLLFVSNQSKETNTMGREPSNANGDSSNAPTRLKLAAGDGNEGAGAADDRAPNRRNRRNQRPQAPGAYAVPGRGSGLVPVWVRRHKAENLSAPTTAQHISPELRVTPESSDLREEGEWLSPSNEEQLQSESEDQNMSLTNASEHEEEATIANDTVAGQTSVMQASVRQMPNQEQEGPGDTKSPKLPKRKKVGLAALVLLVAIGVVVGVVMAIGGSSKSELADPAPTLAPTDVTFTCDFQDPAEQDNPIWQCLCHNELLEFPPEAAQRYEQLRDAIVSPLLPDFSEERDSCAPQNAALWQLATDSLAGAEATVNRYLLTLLYVEWEGHEWISSDGWLSRDVSPCNGWHGIACNFDGKTISEVALSGNNLKGSVPVELALLSDLEMLDLTRNELAGTVPTDIFRLTSLKKLKMSSNFLMGTLPQGESFASMTDLQELRLPYNQFSGSVPPMIGALTNLHFLDMSNNAFDEPLPTDIGNLSALEVLLFHATYTEGPLPSEIGQLENLRALNGKGCIRLGGSIPSEFGRLSRLEYFDLDLTEITGTIPSEIGGMENVGYFGLRSTQVAGTIPSEIGKLEKLFELDLSYTDLTGSLPSELGLLTNLEKLRLDHIHLSGTMPGSICDLRDGNLHRFVAICNDQDKFQCQVPDCCSECT